MASSKLTLKLLIDAKRDRVLFAEASKDVVDFLINLLQFPLATVVKLLTKKGAVGSIGNLYASIENLDAEYLHTNLTKEALLHPKISVSSPVISGLLPSTVKGNGNAQSTIPVLYMCASACDFSVTEVRNSRCVHYFDRMTNKVIYNKAASSPTTSSCSSDGFVKGVVTYMVMDNLVIQPMSAISSITMLNQFNVMDVGVLKEKVVTFGMEEGIKLLKASLQSDMVLTSVFMKILGSYRKESSTSYHHI